MELKEIRALIDLMKKNGLAVFKMEKEGFKITLQTNAEFHPTPTYAAPQVASAPLASIAPAPSDSTAPAASGDKEIVSPMVGTYYSSPSPESPAFVEVGTVVNPETVVCIVEAMKVMNEIKAEVSGTITEIGTEDGKPVQFGQALFRVK